MILGYIILYIILYYSILYYVILYYVILYYVILYDIRLYYIILYLYTYLFHIHEINCYSMFDLWSSKMAGISWRWAKVPMGNGCAIGKLASMVLHGSVSKPCTPVLHIKIAGKWMFILLKMVLIGIDPYPYGSGFCFWRHTSRAI